jgi:hypothetical protein
VPGVRVDDANCEGIMKEFQSDVRALLIVLVVLKLYNIADISWWLIVGVFLGGLVITATMVLWRKRNGR